MRLQFRCLSAFANCRLNNEFGAVTSEFVLVLPAVFILVLPFLGVVGWQFEQVKLWQVAAVVARAASHGEPNPTEWATRMVSGSAASVQVSSGLVCATVTGSSGAATLLGHPGVKICTRESGY